MRDEVRQRIARIVTADPVVLFMKGTPLAPQCGFSANVTRVLMQLGVAFSSVNVLEEPEIREGVKAYADWPTIPQLYIGGEFVGGADIVRDMMATGELIGMLRAHHVALPGGTP
ncbi:Grx4 family monothiol glutaredoxin [Acidocella sp.]|uniref:Grx4 family monothiol glutaredoxin n=1 Tax=Acidocella sp. TaxID=50710 RepID=UPI0026252CF8|nr:Grx4 family monothiol glutaredoxin [Acidocella sp.]